MEYCNCHPIKLVMFYTMPVSADFLGHGQRNRQRSSVSAQAILALGDRIKMNAAMPMPPRFTTVVNLFR